MNIFENQEIFFGQLPLARLADAYLDFFKLAGDIRSRLGRKTYLLDNYIAQLFDAIEEAYSSPTQLGGSESIASLYSICQASRHPDRHLPHPFFNQARDFIRSHPLDFADKSTKTWLYVTILANAYITASAEAYREEFNTIMDKHLDRGEFNNTYRKITDLLGSEEQLEQLNLLFKARFLAVPAQSAFYHNINNELIEALTPRDPETSLQIFQLLLNHHLLEQLPS